MNCYYSIDSISTDEGKARLIADDDSIATVNAFLLPINAREGDVLTLSDGKYIFNKEETERRRVRIRAKLAALLDGNKDKL